MMPRPHPETKENQHKRFARHIGSIAEGFSCYFTSKNRKAIFLPYFLLKDVPFLGQEWLDFTIRNHFFDKETGLVYIIHR
jgi:hypothetical protein